MVGLNKYLNFAKALALEAGALAMKHQGKISRISYKGRMNLVTDVDKKCDRLIVSRIRDAFADHQILSEETGRHQGKGNEFCWLVDPIDGTTNYAHGFPFFCISIALLKKDEPVSGVVYDPAREELFSAAAGKGAFLNKKRIRVSNTRSLKRSLLGTGFPYRFGKDMHRNIAYFSRFMMKAQAVRRAGSAALDICYVAAARLEGFWEMDLHPWDTAAAALIVKEAGGRSTIFNGGDFSPFEKEIVVSNAKIHKQMLKVLR